MVDRTKINKVEREFCKRTGKLAHNGCLEREKKLVPKDKVFEACDFHKKLKISSINLEIFLIMENEYKRENGKYEIKRALDENKFIRKAISDYPEDPFAQLHDLEDQGKLERLLSRVNKYKKKRIIKEFFGSGKMFSRLCDEIRTLIEKGVNLDEKIEGELRSKLRLYKKYEDKDWNIIKDFWEWVFKEEYEGKTDDEIRQLSEIRKLLREQKPLEWKKKIDKQKPFKFEMSDLINASSRKVLDEREVRILIYRYSLNGEGTRTLKLIAGWLGISPTIVRNIEFKALRKLQAYLSLPLDIRDTIYPLKKGKDKK